MTGIKAFEALPIEEKARVMLNEGSFHSTTSFKHIKITLYRLHGEFVEVWYDLNDQRAFRIEYMKEKKVNPFLKHFDADRRN